YLLFYNMLFCPISVPFPGSSSHSLHYLYTMVSESGFFVVVFLDDQPITCYNSNTRRQEPLVPWMQKKETVVARDNEVFFRKSLQAANSHYEHGGGECGVQEMYGCELSRDGRKGEFWQNGYYGKDYLTFDQETLTWTATDATAQSSKRKWDADSRHNRYMEAYLEEECVEWLQRFLHYGKEALLRTGVSGGKWRCCTIQLEGSCRQLVCHRSY
uniref:MHC class I-like antigen recognition-like domain-containing protein n=1 Tax=Varanus komodoensis TaxID=61221 RepID=A0A8D2KRA2_VARKO